MGCRVSVSNPAGPASAPRAHRFPPRATVSATRIGQRISDHDLERYHLGKTARSFYVRDTDEHGPAIGLRLINAIQDGYALGERAKVVIVDGRGLAIPLGAGVFEVPDQFPFLRI